DTATAHLAGALGVPVWVALPFVAEWRWLLHREDSPWYPSARLFRQARPGDWEGVFRRMAAAVPRSPARSGLHRPVTVEVAPGELIDKITILEIKNARITDPAKLAHVRLELVTLMTVRDQAVPMSGALAQLTAELRAVNEALWQIEDDLRRCERDQDFGP